MTVQEMQPFVMHNAVVIIGTDDFAKATSSAELTPSGGTVPFKGLKNDAVWTFPESVTWELTLNYGQDWTSEASLSRYLFDHIGEIVPFTLNPDDAGATVGSTSWGGEVAITAGAVGGAVDAVAEASVTLGVQGAPVPTYTAATP